MKVTFFIAKKLKLNSHHSNHKKKGSSLTLNIAVFGISLAIVIMIISIAIVNGFKNEITSKIYDLNPQIEISSYNFENVNADKPITIGQFNDILKENKVEDKAYLFSQKSVVLKTDNDFLGVTLNGYDNNYNSEFIERNLIDGRLPNLNNDSIINEIIISKTVADKLELSVDDKIFAFFINDKIKARKLSITGIFNTNFEDFDKNFIIGNQTLIRNINRWNNDEGTTLAISNLNNDSIIGYYDKLYHSIQEHTLMNQIKGSFYITNIHQSFASFFEWLKLLDSNIIIILILMAFVSIFTLISGLLIIILERIDTIGTLKAIGATNTTIRNIFILLSQKIIIKALIIGNITAITFCCLQSKFHLIELDASSYFMNHVPIDINVSEILILNICILIISLLSLIIPSFVISTITPSKSIKYE